MKKLVLLFIALLLVSCSPGDKEAVTTANQASIIRQYNQIDAALQNSLDSLERHLERMNRSSENEPDIYKAMTAIGYGRLYSNRSSYEVSLKSYEKAIRLLKGTKQDTLLAKAYTGIGNYYKNTGDYPQASNYLLKGLRIFENAENLNGVATTNANIGQLYMQRNDQKQSKEFLLKAMKTLANHKSHFAYLTSAHTLANVYGSSGDMKSALKIDKEGLRIADSIGSDKIKVTFLDNMANCYMYSGKLDSAEYYFKQCLKIDIQTGDRKQVADSYSNLGYLAMLQKDYQKAVSLTKKSIGILEEIDHRPNLLKSYDILGDIYEGSGNLKLALQSRNVYIDIYRKMMNEKNEQALADFKVVYETEKKEKIIAQNKIALLESEQDLKRRNYMIAVISIAALFIAITGFLIYRQQKLKNRQQAQEHELKSAIASIETQNKLQEQRLDISRDLHDNIGAQLTFVISSVDNIRYAFDIKNTKLEDKLHSISNFTKATIIELRDTIWAMNSAEISLEDLRSRIYNFIEKAKDVREEIDFHFNIDKELQLLRFTSLTGMNIYRTIQEAVNNAIKYSAASHIGIYIEKEARFIRIRIEDNGAGFLMETVAEGNGLNNMRKRVDEIGGEINITTSKGNGTHIHILLDPNAKKFQGLKNGG